LLSEELTDAPGEVHVIDWRKFWPALLAAAARI
jgi:hypothetical protein